MHSDGRSDSSTENVYGPEMSLLKRFNGRQLRFERNSCRRVRMGQLSVGVPQPGAENTYRPA